MTTTGVRAQVAGWNRPLLGLTAAAVVLTAVTLAGLLLDDRTLLGVPIWLKPFKFSVSFILYAGTLAWMFSLLPRRGKAAERATVVIVATSVAEMAVILTQVGRGQTSHFNVTTGFNAALWALMGASIMVLFLAQVVVAVVVLRARIGDRLAATGVRLGLGLSLLGMLAALPMTMMREAVGGVAGSHSIGVADGGPGLPVLGWSTTGGDLRAGHFIGLHALQALPLLALLLTRFTRTTEAARVRLLLVAGSGYGALTLLLTWQALRGQPVTAPDALTLTALGAVVAGTLTAATMVLAADRKVVVTA
ncbi:hypothetical protein [Actinoplanes sp. NPDC051494]|uniref:hypothetical protein n=1 Tax=Actinoplanes sp. NPDC051494 TaxID=3363907 RepID=UPI0037B9104E